MYMQDRVLRVAVRRRLIEAVKSDTRVIVGHSLGAVVAYETLCLHPELPVTTLVTIGSPLGIRNMIFDRLEPTPENSVGKWPSKIQFWHNIVDPSDIVTLGKPLRPLFGPRVNDLFVDNGRKPHDFRRYLSTAETGYSISSGLQG
jgi:pimeloyl-ACP methyl ester carboxylesterase